MKKILSLALALVMLLERDRRHGRRPAHRWRNHLQV